MTSFSAWHLGLEESRLQLVTPNEDERRDTTDGAGLGLALKKKKKVILDWSESNHDS